MTEYIKREAVEKFITKGLNNPDKSKAYGYDAVEILTEVHYMPAEDVAEVRRGRWVYISGDVGYTEVECSWCKKRTVLVDEDEIPPPYCSQCGADLTGGKSNGTK